MALRRVFEKKFKGVQLKTGHIYTFEYQAWENDPKPTIIYMYSVEGIHPNTGHEHRYIQALNFTYVPRSVRKQFIRLWVDEFQRTKNIRLTWERVKSKYPYLVTSIRRYFFKPTYYISNLKEIPFDDWEKTVVSTWSKDFSKKVKVSLVKKFRRLMSARNIFKKTGKFPKRK
jgi:hypothetical protein